MPNTNISLSMPDLGRYTHFVVTPGNNAVIQWDFSGTFDNDPAAVKAFNEILSKLCLEACKKDADTKFKSIRDLLIRKDKEIAAELKAAKKTKNVDTVFKGWEEFVETVNESLKKIAETWGENFCKFVDKDLVPKALKKLKEKLKRDEVTATVKTVVKVAAVVVIALAAIAATVLTLGAAAGVFAIAAGAVAAAKTAVDSYGKVKAASAKLSGKEVEAALAAMKSSREDAIEALESRKEAVKKSYLLPLAAMRLNLVAIKREIDTGKQRAADDTVTKAIRKWEVAYELADRQLEITEQAMKDDVEAVDKKINLLKAVAAISPPASDLQRTVEQLGKPFTTCMQFFSDLRKLAAP